MSIVVKAPDLRKLAKFITSDDLRKAAERLIEQQEGRITSGRGSRGGNPYHFRRYTRGYREFRQRKGMASAVRTLRLTGRMLDSRAVKRVSNRSARIGFSENVRYFFVQQANTPFLKPTKKEREFFQEDVLKAMRARLSENVASIKRG